MNKHNINLLHDERIHASEKDTKILWIIASSTLLIVAVSSIIIFVMKMQSQLPVLQKNENDLLSSMSLFQTKIIKHILFTDRLNNIESIISKRTLFDTKLDEVMLIISSELKIHNISMDKKKLSLTMATLSLASIETFNEKLKEMLDNKKLFSRVSFSGITVNQKKGEYSFTIEADLL